MRLKDWIRRDPEPLVAEAGPETADLAMVACYPRTEEAEALAVEKGLEVDDLHCTLVFLGEAEGVDAEVTAEAVALVASELDALAGNVGGLGQFAEGPDGVPVIALPDVQGLTLLRERVVDELGERGIRSPSEHGFLPHMTLLYKDPAEDWDAIGEFSEEKLGRELHFDAVSVVIGGERTDYELRGARVAAAGEPEVPATPQELTAATDRARERIEESIDPLAASYEKVLRAAGRRIARSLRAKADSLTADAGFVPPDEDEVVDGDKLAADVKASSRESQRDAARAVAAALEAEGISFDVDQVFTDELLDAIGARATFAADQELRGIYREVIAEAADGGWSISRTAEAIVERVDDMAGYRATALARTDLVGLANGGSVHAAQQTVAREAEVYKVWLATDDEATRDSHIDANGQVVPVKEPFVVGGAALRYPGDPFGPAEEVINCRCVAPWTAISDGRLAHAMRRPFEGQLWRITTAGGREMTVTANHPVLTRAGWKPAQLLEKGDELLCAVEGDLASGGPDVDDVPTLAADLYRTLSLSGVAGSERVPSTRVNFHGDVPDRDVYVSGTDDLLTLCGDSALTKEFHDLALSLAQREMSLPRYAPALRDVAKAKAVGLRSASGRTVVAEQERRDALPHEAVLSRQGEHAHASVKVSQQTRRISSESSQELLRLDSAQRPRGDAVLLETVPDGHRRDADLIGDALERVAGLVETDPVVDVVLVSHKGHVYNFATETGILVTGGILTANCTVIYTSTPGEAVVRASAYPADTRMEETPMSEVATKRKIKRQAIAADANGEVVLRDPVAWDAVLCVEGETTEDMRLLERGSTSWRELPLTLMGLIETSEWGHEGAQVSGRIDEILRVIDDISSSGDLTTDFGIDTLAPMIADRTVRGVSVDLAVLDYEYRDAETGEKLTPEEEFEYWLEGKPAVFAVLDGVIVGATVCPMPAIANAEIALAASAALSVHAKTILASALEGSEVGPSDVPIIRVFTPFDRAKREGLFASAVRFATEAPPRSAFELTEFPGKTPLTITDDGRVFGHIATWDTCHVGIPGVCTTAPRSSTTPPYSYFHTSRVLTEEGQTIDVGNLMLGTGHAHLGASRMEATRHYDKPDMVGARVRAYDGEHGIWVSGVVRPELSATGLRELRENPPSGDWRSVAGRLELIAVCAVAVPGFPVVADAQANITAAGGEIGISALIASPGAIVPTSEVKDALIAAGCGCEDLVTDDEGVDALAELAVAD